jgi:hypothetical protein
MMQICVTYSESRRYMEASGYFHEPAASPFPRVTGSGTQ